LRSYWVRFGECKVTLFHNADNESNANNESNAGNAENGRIDDNETEKMNK
jgi:hypothetical protein